VTVHVVCGERRIEVFFQRSQDGEDVGESSLHAEGLCGSFSWSRVLNRAA
jgi:hypothetical protein